ncbi:MAG TPA: hypothetical protein VFQ14_04320 [Thermoleophilaceae bacterium]|nr:hypothetical protein [Thermoleophilaceae bacterium]
MPESAVAVRARVLIDKLQPQCAAFLGTVSRGDPPLAGQAAAYIEVAPGMAINLLTDVILKSGNVRPGMQVVERQYGLLEVHAPSPNDVTAALETGLGSLGASVDELMAPEVVSSNVIHSVDPYQAQLINRIRHGGLVLPGDSLFVLEVEPAPFAALAANEAEKRTDVTICEFRSYGRTGNLYVSGDADSTQSAQEVCAEVLGAGVPA